MILRISTTAATLDEHDDLGRLSVEAPADADVDLAPWGVVDADGGHIWLDAQSLRSLGVQQGASEEWERGLEGMFAYAGSKGWLDDAGRVRAHIVRT